MLYSLSALKAAQVLIGKISAFDADSGLSLKEKYDEIQYP